MMDTDRKLRFDGIRDWFLSSGEEEEENSSFPSASSIGTNSTSSGSSPLQPPPTEESPPPPCPPAIIFRPIQPQDREIIQALHEDWFPVTYHGEFYDDLVHNGQQHGWGILKHPAITTQPQHPAALGSQSPPTPGTSTRSLYTCMAVRNDEEDASVCACVVGCFLPATHLSLRMRELLLPHHHHRPHNGHRHHHPSKAFYIMTLGVVSTYRNEGLGSRLVQKCERLVQHDPDCGVLYLHVITYNYAAIRLYEKLGFYRVEEIENYYTINGQSHNALLYAKYFHGNPGHRYLLFRVKETAHALWRHMVATFPRLWQWFPHQYYPRGYHYHDRPRLQQRTL